MDLPPTLHGQLYLLAYDRNRHRFDFDNLWLLGFALRAAMLTDLFLTGYLQDTEGKACQASHARPGDPVLRAVFDTIGVSGPKTWAWLIAANEEHAPRLVRDQLKGHGWLCPQRRRTLGIIPAGRLGLYDEGMVRVGQYQLLIPHGDRSPLAPRFTFNMPPPTAYCVAHSEGTAAVNE